MGVGCLLPLLLNNELGIADICIAAWFIVFIFFSRTVPRIMDTFVSRLTEPSPLAVFSQRASNILKSSCKLIENRMIHFTVWTLAFGIFWFIGREVVSSVALGPLCGMSFGLQLVSAIRLVMVLETSLCCIMEESSQNDAVSLANIIWQVEPRKALELQTRPRPLLANLSVESIHDSRTNISSQTIDLGQISQERFEKILFGYQPQQHVLRLNSRRASLLTRSHSIPDLGTGGILLDIENQASVSSSNIPSQ